MKRSLRKRSIFWKKMKSILIGSKILHQLWHSIERKSASVERLSNRIKVWKAGMQSSKNSSRRLKTNLSSTNKIKTIIIWYPLFLMKSRTSNRRINKNLRKWISLTITLWEWSSRSCEKLKVKSKLLLYSTHNSKQRKPFRLNCKKLGKNCSFSNRKMRPYKPTFTLWATKIEMLFKL